MSLKKENILALYIVLSFVVIGFLFTKNYYLEQGEMTTLQTQREKIKELKDKVRNIQAEKDLLEEENKEARMIIFISDKYNKPKNKIAKIWEEVQNKTEEGEIDPILMMALIATESSFNSKAVSHAGAVGLTQVIPYWHKEKIGSDDLMNHHTSIRVGVDVLDEYLKRENGDMYFALQRYNGNKKDKTQRYANKVIKTKETLLSIMDRPINS